MWAVFNGNEHAFGYYDWSMVIIIIILYIWVIGHAPLSYYASDSVGLIILYMVILWAIDAYAADSILHFHSSVLASVSIKIECMKYDQIWHDFIFYYCI